MRLNRMFCASVLGLAILAGCGGGGDGTPAAAPTPVTTQGQLTNSPIDGVGYEALPSGLMGTTANGGLFDFQAGDTVTFNIAGLEIAVPGATRITPQTIAEALADGDTMAQANILANLTTFFQTIDSDGDAENGSVTIPSNITFSNATDLLNGLEMAPGDFQTTFQAAIDGAYAEGSEPTIVDSTEAMLRFYRNELQGNWRLVSATEGSTTITSNADYQVLLSFDVGNPDAGSSSPEATAPNVVNSFVFSEYDISDPADPFSVVAVGTVNYDEMNNEFEFTSLPRTLLADGPANSSTDQDNAVFTSKIQLDGTQLELTLVDAGSTIVATFERFDNEKESLVGSWYEVFAQGDDGLVPVAEPDSQGRVSFGSDVASVFYYFLSDTRVMLVFTDLNPEFMSDERNGVIVANYSLNSTGDTLTFGSILLDSVSVDPVNNPAFEAGLALDVGPALRNDTNRVLTDSESEPADTLTLFRILSLSERVGDFVQQAQ